MLLLSFPYISSEPPLADLCLSRIPTQIHIIKYINHLPMNVKLNENVCLHDIIGPSLMTSHRILFRE